VKHRRSRCRSPARPEKRGYSPKTRCSNMALKPARPAAEYPHSYPQRFPRSALTAKLTRSRKCKGHRPLSYPCIRKLGSRRPPATKSGLKFCQAGKHTMVKPCGARRSCRCAQGPYSGSVSVCITKAAQESAKPRVAPGRGAHPRCHPVAHKLGFKQHVNDVTPASPGQAQKTPDRSRYWATLDVQPLVPGDPGMHQARGTAKIVGSKLGVDAGRIAGCAAIRTQQYMLKRLPCMPPSHSETVLASRTSRS
jgi:hypothetical protein